MKLILLTTSYMAVGLSLLLFFTISEKRFSYEKRYTATSLISVQEDSVEVENLINKIRTATKHFQDYKKAQAAGYQPLGPDMPNMGVHWINTSLAIDSTLDFTKPSTLTYLNIDGELVLAGVAYTYPVKKGEKPPALPLDDMRWHYHSGNLAKEAHGIHQKNMQRNNNSDTYLAMVHAWVWAENPDGIFAADNWALSYMRFSLDIPPEINPKSSKALFLADGGVKYYLKFVELCVEQKSIDSIEIKRVVKKYAKVVQTIIDTYEKGEIVSKEDQTRLVQIWNKMWNGIKNLVSEENWKAIAAHLQLPHPNEQSNHL